MEKFSFTPSEVFKTNTDNFDGYYLDFCKTICEKSFMYPDANRECIYGALIEFFRHQNTSNNKKWENFIKTPLYFLCQNFLSVKDFMHHFNEFEQTDETERYERFKAEECLKRRNNGSWLLRYSSKNRLNDNENDLYFAFSLKINDKISHRLFKYKYGKYWSIYASKNGELYEEIVFSFIDVIKYFCIYYNLDLTQGISNYFSIDYN